ncbi:MAG: hypothetical protein IID43_05010 [Planctomycetes bacterium]|nr:hypothetical protein [Planctomycetota bacterium]
MHDTSTNNTRLTATTAGTYLISASIAFAANTTGLRLFRFRVDGAGNGIAEERRDAATTAMWVVMSTIHQFTAGQYVELMLFQSSGGNLSTVKEGNSTPEFMMTRIAA